MNGRTAILKRALDFYADPANYIDAKWDDGSTDGSDTPNAIPAYSQEGAWVCDCGDIARAAVTAFESAPPSILTTPEALVAITDPNVLHAAILLVLDDWQLLDKKGLMAAIMEQKRVIDMRKNPGHESWMEQR